ncbi:MAG: peptidylprolyl isomerase [Flavobacteriaceae bacterium]
MAILNSIRKRGFFLILIIALALFAFILSDIINKGGGNGNSQNIVATVNGKELSREYFMGKVDAYQRSLGPNANTSQAMNTVWDRELRTLLFNQQAEALGLGVSEDQLNETLALSLSNNPTFQDENGIYSEARVVEYVASIQNNAVAKQQWDEFINGVKESILQNNYINLVKSGLSTTVAEGEEQYHFENDQADIEYLHVPYTKIADEDVAVSDSDIEAYMRKHASEYEVDPIVDIQYISFAEEPSMEDIEAAKADMETLKEAFSNAEDAAAFIGENSDKPLVDRWYFEKDLPTALKDTILKVSRGSVYGPYTVEKTLNISKITKTIQLPDSAEARHILIPVGLSKKDSITRTPQQAEALADSLLAVLKKDKSKFGDFVEKYSSDTGSAEKAGHYDWFGYNTMVAPFRDFCFEKNVGDMGVVETQFGYHLIEVEGQKNKKEAYKIATVTKEIEPSEATLSQVFSESAKFEEAVRSGDFTKIAEEKGLTPKPVNKIGKLDSNIPGIGYNRTIVNWAFQEDTKVGDVKRENINNMYVVVQLTRKSDKKALMSIAEASATVTPIIRNKKKAQKIRESIKGTTLQEMATSQNVATKTANAITRSTPTIAGAGTEPLVVGSIFGKAAGEMTPVIDGETGVFAVRVVSVNKAAGLESYAAYVNQLKSAVNSGAINTKVFNALKKAADIEDNRADFY